jgi:hypothetical protein
VTFVAEIVSGGVLGPDNLAASLALAMRMVAAVNALLIVRLRIAKVSGALIVVALTLILSALVLRCRLFGLRLHTLGQSAEAARLADRERLCRVGGAVCLAGRAAGRLSGRSLGLPCGYTAKAWQGAQRAPVPSTKEERLNAAKKRWRVLLASSLGMAALVAGSTVMAEGKITLGVALPFQGNGWQDDVV